MYGMNTPMKPPITHDICSSVSDRAKTLVRTCSGISPMSASRDSFPELLISLAVRPSTMAGIRTKEHPGEEDRHRVGNQDHQHDRLWLALLEQVAGHRAQRAADTDAADDESEQEGTPVLPSGQRLLPEAGTPCRWSGSRKASAA